MLIDPAPGRRGGGGFLTDPPDRATHLERLKAGGSEVNRNSGI
jgi:hypothetical protein